MAKSQYRFCVGPWNFSEGVDPYGPTTRPAQTFDWKLAGLKKLGFDAMMFHDDDAVPDIDSKSAAQVLKDKKIAGGVQLMVAPASLKDRAQAEAEGTMRILTDAGASVLPSACGACAGYGDGFAEGQTVISSTARNFKGRMGGASTQVFLGSAYTVAASALRGCITDPREVLA